MTFYIQNHIFLRIIFSFGGLALFWGVALALPYRRTPSLHNVKRWVNNLSFSFGNGVIIALLVPFTLMQLSEIEYLKSFTIFRFDFLPFLLEVFLGVLILDLAIYWQHRLSHKIPLFWRLHRMHHSDVEIDTTTAGRFHTFEILLSFFYKALFVIAFGIPATAILIFEILLNFSSLFNHSNFHFPSPVEKVLRWLVITPDLHRVHHSVRGSEMNRNFGFSISLWDRVFKSFLEETKEDPQTMKVGLNQYRSKEEQTLLSLLIQPFKRL